MLRIFTCCTIFFFAGISNTYAQSEEQDRELYSANYFERYAPQTAADMVLQLPSFTLKVINRRNSNVSQRGLGQGQSNLLINGKRPSTKNDSPIDILERIPANQVLRLEILNDGSAELSGQSGKIVNVVVTESETLNGSWKTEIYMLNQGRIIPKVEGSITGKLGSATFSTGLNHTGHEFLQLGDERVWDETDIPFEIRDEITNYVSRGTTLNLNLGWEFDDSSANVSFIVTENKSTLKESSDRFQWSDSREIGDLFTVVDYQSNNEKFSYELGGDYRRMLGMGELKLIGLFRHLENEDHQVFEDIPINDDDHYLFHSISKPKEQESILKSMFSFEPSDDHHFEIAIEIVKNILKTTSTYREDIGHGFKELTLDGSNTEVEEERADFSVQYSTALTKKLSFQASMGNEYSEISVDGPDSRSETFSRPKGFISFSWAQTQDRRIRARIERSVGQLNFHDFASSLNVNDGTTTGGNTQLVPDQSWRAELSIEQQFGDKNSIIINVFREQQEDFIIMIPIGNGSESLGNIDLLESKGIDISATINMQPFGIVGGKLDLIAELHSNELDDPVTGKRREYRKHGYIPELYQLTFRQDFPQSQLAWGMTLREISAMSDYRIDTVRDWDHTSLQQHKIFLEYKDLWGMVMKVELEDIFGYTSKRERVFYDGDRNGDVVGRETSRKDWPWILRLSLSGAF